MAFPDPTVAVEQLKQSLLRHRNTTEANRRLPEEVVRAIVQTGFNRLMLTDDVGGAELHPVTFMQILEALAGAEASASWIVWNNALPCWMSRYLTPAGRGALFADPNWLYANSTRPSGTAVRSAEGYRISGRWSLVSGCELAEWIMLMCVVNENDDVVFVEPGVPEMRMAFVHKASLEIVDTWHVGGMRGTGSHDVVVKDCDVPLANTFTPMDAVSSPAPIARLPIVSTMAGGLGAQLLGIAQMAIDTVKELGRTKTGSGSVPGMRDRVPTQIAIASHPAAINGARLNLYQTIGSSYEKALNHRPIELDDIAAMWSAAIHACDTARWTIDAMYTIAGTTAIYESSLLERAHRDARVMLQHIVSQPMWLEDAGRHALGLDITNPQFTL